MRRLIIPLSAIVVMGFVAGCEPAPSTPLAPDVKVPDTSKMSPAEIERIHNAANGVEADRKPAGTTG